MNPMPTVKNFQQEMEEQEEREEKATFMHRSMLVDVRKLLLTAEGRRFFKWFFLEFPLFDQCYTKNADTYYLLGRQSVSRDVYLLLKEVDPAFMVAPVFQEDGDVEPA